mmetsp:Transcript_23712/g.45128  ORF Transcript_23712/g.45128 Transcript_23712/m.45128 type:complete len:109 (-) Transcript_23712:230-556(-)
MLSKPESPTTAPSPPRSMGLSLIAQSQRRSRTADVSSSLGKSERRQRVEAFHDALKSDSTGILTLPEYVSPDLSPDQTLSLVLQEACSTANSLVGFMPDNSDDEEEDQ